MDWYRLEGENAHLSAGRLDLPKVFKSYVSLVEWPERLDKALLPDQYAKIEMHVDDANPDLRHLDVDIRGDDPQRWQDYFPREHEVAKLHPRH
jgi:tRNA A37 threonylcarbamoyladenosine biosynthesis protein TsaE